MPPMAFRGPRLREERSGTLGPRGSKSGTRIRSGAELWDLGGPKVAPGRVRPFQSVELIVHGPRGPFPVHAKVPPLPRVSSGLIHFAWPSQ